METPKPVPNRAARRAAKSKRKSPAGMTMRSPKVGPSVPVGYINIEEWGLETGRGRVAAYAAAKRREVEVEYYGVMCVREDWRERNAARAAKEAEEGRRQYLEEGAKRHRQSSSNPDPEPNARPDGP
jgi:hypothetical protein